MVPGWSRGSGELGHRCCVPLPSLENGYGNNSVCCCRSSAVPDTCSARIPAPQRAPRPLQVCVQMSPSQWALPRHPHSPPCAPHTIDPPQHGLHDWGPCLKMILNFKTVTAEHQTQSGRPGHAQATHP